MAEPGHHRIIFPIVNTLYNYVRGGDVRDLLGALPNFWVHASFLLGLGLAVLGLVLSFTHSAQAKMEGRKNQ